MAELRTRRFWFVVVVAVVATVCLLWLLQNIWTRKREAEEVVFHLVDIDETVVDPALCQGASAGKFDVAG